MKRLLITLTLLTGCIATAQDYTFHKDVDSAIVWESPTITFQPLSSQHTSSYQKALPNDAYAFLIIDPLTNQPIHKLEWQNIAVLSQVVEVYDNSGWSSVNILIHINITIVNHSEYPTNLGKLYTTLNWATKKQIHQKNINTSYCKQNGSAATCELFLITPYYPYSPEHPLQFRYSIRINSRDWVFPWTLVITK